MSFIAQPPWCDFHLHTVHPKNWVTHCNVMSFVTTNLTHLFQNYVTGTDNSITGYKGEDFNHANKQESSWIKTVVIISTSLW